MHVIFFLFVAFALANEYDHTWQPHEKIELYVNKVGPLQNPQETYEYYHLPFCQPVDVIETSEGLGEALSGFELKGSIYPIKFRVPIEDKEVCSVQVDEEVFNQFSEAIQSQYWFEFFFDDLPLWGLVGVIQEEKKFLYLHYQFTIEFNEDQIISIKVEEKKPTEIKVGTNLTFSYGVTWKVSTVFFEDRFDKYLDEDFFNHNIHWYSILNSTMLIALLVGIVAIILTRSLNRDIQQHKKSIDGDLDVIEGKGWRKIQNDVFRPPQYLILFSALVGIGCQLVALTFFFIVMAIFVYHNNPFYRRGTMLTIAIVLYTLTSFISGMVSGNYFKKNGGKDWIKCLFLTAFIFPVVVTIVVLVLNLIALAYHSLAYIPFVTMMAVFFLWLFISIPLTLLGTLFGRHQGEAKNYGLISPFPNTIPAKKPFQQLWVHFVAGGILPFSVVSIEMYFVFTAFFESKFYYVFSFLLLVFFVLIIVTVCVSVVSTYILLNNEDYRWQWTSFLSCASTSLYTFMYSLFYYVRMSKMSGFFQTSFYFGYIAIICFGFALFLGAVSFLSSQLFVYKIYNVIHID